MKISCSRLESRLNDDGFVLRKASGFGDSFGFVRPDRVPGLYQQIDVCFAGRRSEAVFAYIAVSVVKWIQIKGLSESRPLSEIAQNEERGWTEITTNAEALEWEDSLACVGPAKATDFSVESSEYVLARTMDARKASQVSLRFLDNMHSVASQILKLKDTVSPELFAEAIRLANFPGVLQQRGAEDTYVLASLAVLNATGGNSFIGEDPLANENLLWQIQLVADGILSSNVKMAET